MNSSHNVNAGEIKDMEENFQQSAVTGSISEKNEEGLKETASGDKSTELMHKGIKNSLLLISAQLINLIINVLVLLFITKNLGDLNYGYYQWFILFFSYGAFLQLGLAQGIYLREGGKNYEDLNRRSLGTQFRIMLVFVCIVLVIYTVIVGAVVADESKKIAMFAAGIASFFSVIQTYCYHIMRAVNRIKDIAIASIINRTLFLISAVVLIFLKVNDFKPYVLAYCVSVAVECLLNVFHIKDIIFAGRIPFSSAAKEIKTNISVGISILMASLVSNLIVSAGKLAVEHFWSMEVFAQISLSLSLTSAALSLIGAVDTVLFPTLRQLDRASVRSVYSYLSVVLSGVMFFVLVFYYPITLFFEFWLPAYAASIKYLAYLFPLLIFEGRYVFLVLTYLQVERKEKFVLFVNITALVLSVVLCLISAVFIKKIEFIALSLLIAEGIRTLIGEIYVQKILGMNLLSDIAEYVILSAVFISAHIFAGGFAGMLIYTAAYIIFIIINRKNIKKLLFTVKDKLFKKKKRTSASAGG